MGQQKIGKGKAKAVGMRSGSDSRRIPRANSWRRPDPDELPIFPYRPAAGANSLPLGGLCGTR
jgi:hypothetical protein